MRVSQDRPDCPALMFPSSQHRLADGWRLAPHFPSRRKPRASSPSLADHLEWPGGPAQILVAVEDAQQEPIRSALRSAGHRVSICEADAQAYRWATALKPELMLLEVALGTPNGLSTARLLKADPLTAHIPMIFVTVGATLSEQLMSLREGAVDCLQAPLEHEDVLMRVAVHLALARRERAVQHNVVESAARVEANDETQSTVAGADDVLAQAVLKIVEADLSNIPNLPALAAQVGTHEKRLSRAFRAYTGKAVFEFVRDARLAHARRLLLESALTVSEVAMAVGYSNAANFATSFRARFGATPTSLRGKGRADTDPS
ncbi:response regulator transcription factor [Variovorax atrisoli]|nr:DNA-binding response regulator [Variovorax paradoxus]